MKRSSSANCNDLVELVTDLGTPHPENRAVQEDVLPAGELRVEACADFEERSDAPVDFGRAGRSAP